MENRHRKRIHEIDLRNRGARPWIHQRPSAPGNCNKDIPVIFTISSRYPVRRLPVQVVHYPATATTHETWIAWPDSSSPSACTSNAKPIQVGHCLETNSEVPGSSPLRSKSQSAPNSGLV
jgi:hypothetical protein